MEKTNIAIILGIHFDKNWQLLDDLKEILDTTANLYEKKKIKKIIVSGKWTIWYDWSGITPSTTEADLMKAYLVDKGISSKDIVKEENSKDTIGNLYYSMLYLSKHPEIKNIYIICSTQRRKRVEALAKKILDPKYKITYFTVNEKSHKDNTLGNENKILEEQSTLLSDLRRGDYKKLSHKIYNSKYYTDQAKAVRQNQRKNELLTEFNN